MPTELGSPEALKTKSSLWEVEEALLQAVNSTSADVGYKPSPVNELLMHASNISHESAIQRGHYGCCS